eukprot:GHVR01154347.1.p1 GENE.GHVR01154347.1~~GHVR01154347.1.p1  ORF type:complete len:257 (-),score=53.57 GHVR01154347.1:222-992(-)
MVHKEPVFATDLDLEILFKFLFPPTLEHPESTGRLDLFARYGPLDFNGQLRAGAQGFHVVCNHEIKGMVKELYREELFRLLARPRETVAVVMESLLKKALKHVYSREELRLMFANTPQDSQGKMTFADIQKVILSDFGRRMDTLIQGGTLSPSIIRPLPYQSKQAEILSSLQKKKKLEPPEEFLVSTHLLHQNTSQITTIGEVNNAQSMKLNTRILRDKGGVDDAWDRYCCIRGSLRGTYVTPHTQLPPPGPIEEY